MFHYQIEYAKSTKSKCKECKANISKGELRIGILIKPQNFYTPLWHHERCFFKKGKRLGTIQKFKEYNKLKHDDLLRIKGQLVDPSDHSYDIDSLGQGLNERDKAILSEYGIEKSNNSRARCKLCNIQIVKNELRISKIEYEEKCGEIKYYYHIQCFSNVQNEFNFTGSCEYFPGFETLSKENQDIVRSSIRPKNMISPHQESSTSLKYKHQEYQKCELDQLNEYIDQQNKENIEEKTDNIVNGIKMETSLELESEAVKVQSELFHKYKSGLRTLSKQDLEIMCRRNQLQFLKGVEERLDLLADCMAFGTLKRCPACDGQLKLNTFFYECTGFLSEYRLCKYRTKSPQRVPMTIPPELKHYIALRDYKPSMGKRIFSDEPLSDSLPSPPKRIKMEFTQPPLKNVQFYILGFKKEDKELIKCRVLKLGGCVANKLLQTVAAVIATRKAYHKNSAFMQDIKLSGFHIVEVSFLDEVESSQSDLSVPEAIELIEKHNISEFSSDIYSRVPRQVVEGEPGRVSGGVYTFKSDKPKISTLKVKDGTPLVSGSGLEASGHVLREGGEGGEGGEAYSATLSRVSLADNVAYTLQLLVADLQKRYCVVRSCGPTGADPKHYKTEFEDLGEAKALFKKVFYQKTGNHWSARHYFQKKRGKFDLVKMADLTAMAPGDLRLDSQSELPTSVQKLMILLFDINIIDKTIADMDIDTDKMPLGILSNEQIATGFNILYSLYEKLNSQTANQSIIEELSTQFYTKIPHKGDAKELILLDNIELILSKMNMLTDLSKTRVSYKILREEMDEKFCLMDQCYLKLQTEIVALESDSPEYETVMTYFLNTQSPEHLFKLQAEQIFRVERQGEAKRFEPFASFGNRKLLWHGSRLSNISGILKHGLCIAPAGVQLTGAMFGKGIYFADVVTKSAQYSHTTPDHPTALLLLCQVALGNMERCVGRKVVTELPEGKDSVWGVGLFRPDPASKELLPDGTEVPLGAIIPNTQDDRGDLELVHNEYIVYDEAQVNIKYLVQFHII